MDWYRAHAEHPPARAADHKPGICATSVNGARYHGFDQDLPRRMRDMPHKQTGTNQSKSDEAEFLPADAPKRALGTFSDTLITANAVRNPIPFEKLLPATRNGAQ